MTVYDKISNQEMHKKIGLKINALRRSNGLTTTQLAAQLGISKSRLERYIYNKNKSIVPLVVVKKCTELFKISFSHFFKN